MKNKEVKAKKGIRFGILDAVIILLIIIAVLGVHFRYNILNFVTGAQNLEKYIVSYSIEDIRYSTEDYFNIGDKVYFSSDNKEFGILVNAAENARPVIVTPASKYFTTSTGNIVKVLYPSAETRIDASGQLECVGRSSSNGGFMVNGSTYIAAGQYVDVYTEYVTVTIRIDSIAPSQAE